MYNYVSSLICYFYYSFIRLFTICKFSYINQGLHTACSLTNLLPNFAAIIENMTEFKSETCGLAGEQGLIEWLLKRIKVRFDFFPF